MSETLAYQWFADAVLALHLAIVAFVIGGLLVVIAGNRRGWRWVNAAWFRLAHVGAIAVVVSESWLGLVCPLTTLEMWLRAKARGSVYAGSFIEHWIGRVLYYDAPAWVFTVVYTVFGVLVAAAWWYFPPRFKRRSDQASL